MPLFGAIRAWIGTYLPILWWCIIEATLNCAVTDRRRIESLGDLEEYFKEAGQDVNSLSSYWQEIFDSYNRMRVKASLQFPFVPDDRFRICIHRPKLNDFDIIIAGQREGTCSYISKTTVTTHKLIKEHGWVNITWCHLNQGGERANTRCKVVPDEKISGLHIVLGQNCRKEVAGAVTDKEEVTEDSKVYNPGRFVDSGLTCATMLNSYDEIDGFAEVFPQHKYHAIEELHRRGHVTAVTGGSQTLPPPAVGPLRNTILPLARQRSYGISEDFSWQRVMETTASLNMFAAIERERKASQLRRHIFEFDPVEALRRGQRMLEETTNSYHFTSQDRSGTGYRG
ncbi:hypothetical protein V496_05396 [Pseudogymnoascus sp. VKM F-4515 (FW-2607)]|nr:hypothetical protein V496_05396 [Pseudogymnoascus sp. VKM F-4515 (FW-2607)]